MLALHAFGGCDTASAIFGHGKGKLFTRLASARELGHHVHILQQPQATKDEVCDAGVALMVALYNGQLNDTLGQMTYRAYSKMVVAKGGTLVAYRLPMGALLIADSELDWIDEEDVASGDFVFDLEITADIRLKVEDEEIC